MELLSYQTGDRLGHLFQDPTSSRMQRAFYVKCRPRGVDAAEIALNNKCVFIGYPPWRRKATWDPHAVSASLLDISIDDGRWNPTEMDPALDPAYRSQVSMNRGFARHVSPGDMVVLPRPGDGLCHIGRIRDTFKLVNNPTWGNEFCKRFAVQHGPSEVAKATCEVVQCWRVVKWISWPFPLLPKWLACQLLRRNTIGWLRDRPEKQLFAATLLDQVFHGKYKAAAFQTTTHLAEVERRILEWTSPASFEQIMCELMQLEQPKHRWWHVGGSGDGGADGLAVDAEGNVTAVLQCKWESTENPYSLGQSLKEQMRHKWKVAPHVYIAMLLHPETAQEEVDGMTFLNLRNIAELLVRHSAKCPAALTLGIHGS